MSEQQPTQEEVQQATSVTQAGAQAAATADNPQDAEAKFKQAAKEERDRVEADIPDDVIDKIAGKTIDMLRNLGAFDPPPEPVTPPQEAKAPPAPSEAAAGPAAEPRPQQRQTWADRFING